MSNTRRTRKTRDINELKSLFKKEDASNNSGNSTDFPYWKLDVGSTTTVRFLPDLNEDNPYGFLTTKTSHTILVNGKKKTIPCRNPTGKNKDDCPLCVISSAFYDAGDKTNGKAFWRKKSQLARVLVTECPFLDDEGASYEGRIMNISLSYSLYTVVKEELGELDVFPDDYDNGTDFIIKKTLQGEYNSYSLSKFARRSSSLTDAQIDFVEDNLIDLSSLLPEVLSFDELDELGAKALAGTEENQPSADESNNTPIVNTGITNVDINDDVDEFPVKKTRKPRKVAPLEVSEEDEVDYDDSSIDSDDPQAILASLQRNANS